MKNIISFKLPLARIVLCYLFVSILYLCFSSAIKVFWFCSSMLPKFYSFVIIFHLFHWQWSIWLTHNRKQMDVLPTAYQNGTAKYVQQMTRAKPKYFPADVSWNPKIVWINQVNSIHVLPFFNLNLNECQFTEYVQTGPAEDSSCPICSLRWVPICMLESNEIIINHKWLKDTNFNENEEKTKSKHIFNCSSVFKITFCWP